MKYYAKGIFTFPATDTLNEYTTEEGVRGLEVQFEWGTTTYTPDTSNSMVKVIRVYENHMVTAGNGKFYKTGITKEIISIDEFTEEYAKLCKVFVRSIKEIMLGSY